MRKTVDNGYVYKVSSPHIPLVLLIVASPLFRFTLQYMNTPINITDNTTISTSTPATLLAMIVIITRKETDLFIAISQSTAYLTMNCLVVIHCPLWGTWMVGSEMMWL